jgi:copper chaperone CopZ
MLRMNALLSLAAGALFLTASAASAETKVTISGTHLCCPQCVKIVGETLKDVSGVTGQCNQKEGTIALSAADDATVQKAVDALAKAGFYGKTDNDKIKYKPVDAPKGKVQKLDVSGVHNCCGACTKAIKAALKDVKGVTSDNVTAKKDAFVVEGDFEPADVVKSLLDAGFYVELKK